MPNWPFSITKDEQERIRVKREEEQQDEKYTEELSAIVLEKMKKIAEEAAG